MNESFILVLALLMILLIIRETNRGTFNKVTIPRVDVDSRLFALWQL